MAQMILGGLGQAIGGPIGAVIGATLGRAVDQRAIAGLEPARQRGPRLETLKMQGTAEGAPMKRAELDGLIDLGMAGIGGLIKIQRRALKKAGVSVEELMKK